MTGDAVTRLRPLVDMDLPAAHALTAALRWPYQLEDWAFNLMLGEGLAAERGGRLIGTAMGWRYGPEAGTLGMVVVTDAAQGSGLGRALTAGVLDMLGKRSVTLYATAAGRPRYRKLGFAGLGRCASTRVWRLDPPPSPCRRGCSSSRFARKMSRCSPRWTDERSACRARC